MKSQEELRKIAEELRKIRDAVYGIAIGLLFIMIKIYIF